MSKEEKASKPKARVLEKGKKKKENEYKWEREREGKKEAFRSVA